jgi:hypothetical protein
MSDVEAMRDALKVLEVKARYGEDRGRRKDGVTDEDSRGKQGY